MVVTHMIDPDTGERERIRHAEADHALKVYNTAGHPIHARTGPAQAIGEAPVSVIFVRSKPVPADNNPGGKLLAVFEITDPTFVARMTEGD